MGTLHKTSQKAPNVEEFLGYDDKGHAVVLRRSVSHPGGAATEAETTPAASQASDSKRLLSGTAGKASKGFGFFAGIEEVRARLQAKRLSN